MLCEERTKSNFFVSHCAPRNARELSHVVSHQKIFPQISSHSITISHVVVIALSPGLASSHGCCADRSLPARLWGAKPVTSLPFPRQPLLTFDPFGESASAHQQRTHAPAIHLEVAAPSSTPVSIARRHLGPANSPSHVHHCFGALTARIRAVPHHGSRAHERRPWQCQGGGALQSFCSTRYARRSIFDRKHG